MGLMKYLLLVAACAGLLGLGVLTLWGELTVSQKELFVVRVPHDFPTIQQAVDAVAEGGTVLIEPGTYQENIQITKSIRLIGTDQSSVIIESSPRSAPDSTIISIEKSHRPLQIYLANFTVKRSNGTPAGISVMGTTQIMAYQLTVSDTDLGFFFGEEVTALLSRVRVKGNGKGIWSIGSLSSLTIDNSIIESNGVGISVLFGSLAVARSLVIRNWVAIEVGAAKEVVLVENGITGNSEGGLYMALGPISYAQEQLKAANQPELGPILVTMRGNEITGNSRYGIALLECLEQPHPLLLSIYLVSSGIKRSHIAFMEQSNKIEGNGEADLCPPDYPWPPGFRK
jgi:hypothetical protein